VNPSKKPRVDSLWPTCRPYFSTLLGGGLEATVYIVKFMKEEYFDAAVDLGRIRIGTFGYFRGIGETSLRDE